MIQPTEAIRKEQLNAYENGLYTVTYEGGVLSCNPPDGHFTIMPSGTRGAYEVCKIVGSSLVFSPKWNGPQKTYILPYVSDAPNS